MLARTLRGEGGTMPCLSRFPRRPLALSACLFLALAAGCGEGKEGGGRGKGKTVDSADGLVVDTQVRRGGPYQPAAVSGGGTITGTVVLPAAAPAAEGACPIPPKTPRAIVWLADIEHGKPVGDVEHRVEVSTGKCRIEPRIQLAPARSTVNVRNDEGYAQRFDFIRGTSPAPVFTAPFVADGQLIPNEQVLAEPGIVEIRSDKDGLRGWAMVVDHPYAATVGADGKFELTDVPAGSYTLAVWTPTGIAEQKVTVSAGAGAPVTITAK
ncbi:MAG TPA: hypothetical protein VGD77_03810 [Gemmatimonadaceae bacterium]